MADKYQGLVTAKGKHALAIILVAGNVLPSPAVLSHSDVCKIIYREHLHQAFSDCVVIQEHLEGFKKGERAAKTSRLSAIMGRLPQHRLLLEHLRAVCWPQVFYSLPVRFLSAQPLLDVVSGERSQHGLLQRLDDAPEDKTFSIALEFDDGISAGLGGLSADAAAGTAVLPADPADHAANAGAEEEEEAVFFFRVVDKNIAHHKRVHATTDGIKPTDMAIRTYGVAEVVGPNEVALEENSTSRAASSTILCADWFSDTALDIEMFCKTFKQWRTTTTTRSSSDQTFLVSCEGPTN